MIVLITEQLLSSHVLVLLIGELLPGFSIYCQQTSVCMSNIVLLLDIHRNLFTVQVKPTLCLGIPIIFKLT